MGIHSLGRDRRESPRLDWDSLSWLFFWDLDKFPVMPLSFSPKDISLNGMKVYCNFPFPLASEQKVRLYDQKAKQQWELAAKIIRIEEIQQANREPSFGIILHWDQKTNGAAWEAFSRHFLAQSKSGRIR